MLRMRSFLRMFLFLLLFVMVGGIAHAQSAERLLPFDRIQLDGDQLWGYLDQDGKEKIKPAYTTAEPFDEKGTAIVGVSEGEEVKYGLIDVTGHYVWKPEYSYLKKWTPDVFIVQTAHETKLVTRNGQTLLQTQGLPEEPAEDMAVFQKNDHYGYLDSKGRVMIQPQYSFATSFSKGEAIVTLSDKRYVVINKQGKVLRTLPYTAGQVYIGEIQDGLAVVTYTDQPNHTGLINFQGKMVVPATYTSINSLHNGRWAVGKGDESLDYPPGGPEHYAIVNSQGQFLTGFVYDSMEPFEGEYAVASTGTSTFFIDQHGKKVENLPTIAGIGSVSIQGNVITATIDNRLQYLRRDGSIIWKDTRSYDLGSGLKVAEAKVRPHRNYLAYYPVLQGMKDQRVQQKINDMMKHQSAVTDSDFNSEDISFDFSVEMYKKNLLVISTTSYVYPFGAAHGMPGLEYTHINLRTGEKFKLDDLFRSGSSYKKKLNEMIREQIKTKGEGMGVFPEVLQNFEQTEFENHFYIDGNTLNIYFYPYEIGPYAAGFITFTIPLDSLKDEVNVNGEFWQSIFNP
ncbi:WG repeat-containing protein [Brevibacillus ginsengisoli]|uniref:WG repeat-containing protein n=1 Tax=Brevibacillus ginsengisoli TaxID=363854 RepID=UPI003CF3039E